MQHLEEGTIHAWLDGALDEAESGRIEQHVNECAACSAAVAEARGMIAGASRVVSSLDVVRGNVIPRASGKTAPRGWLWRSLRLSPARAAIAATLLFAVATTLTVQHAPNRAASTANAVAADAKTSAQSSAGSHPAAAVAGTPAAAPPIASASAAPDRSNSAADARAARRPQPATGVPSIIANAPPPPNAAEPRKQAPPVAEQTATLGARALRDSASGLDSTAKASAKPAGVQKAASASAAVFGLVVPAQAAGAVAASGASSTSSPAGCYELASDSTSARADLAPVPMRFALEQAQGRPARNIVRAVTAQGRIDSVIAGSRWERLTPTMTKIYLTQARGESASTLTMRFAGETVSGQVATPAGTRNVNLNRAVCRP